MSEDKRSPNPRASPWGEECLDSSNAGGIRLEFSSLDWLRLCRHRVVKGQAQRTYLTSTSAALPGVTWRQFDVAPLLVPSGAVPGLFTSACYDRMNTEIAGA